MTKPQRIQLSRKKGFNLQRISRELNGLEAVNCARPGPWGNPFIVGKHGARARCVELFELLLIGYACISMDSECADAQLRWSKHAKNHLIDLRGKNLACWCHLPKPGEPDICHAAILLELANKL